MSARRYLLLCAGILLIILIVILAACAKVPQQNIQPAPEFETSAAVPSSAAPDTVRSVYDGDTLTVSPDTDVRVLGIDTPELTPKQCYGIEARDAARAVLPQDGEVLLTPDAAQPDKDRYGRSLRYVSTPELPDLGAFLIAGGYARVYEEYPVARTPEYLRLQEQAQQQRLGIWSEKCSS